MCKLKSNTHLTKGGKNSWMKWNFKIKIYLKKHKNININFHMDILLFFVKKIKNIY